MPLTLTVKLSQASGVPYYRQIVDQIGQMIRSGQLPPRTQLPSVRELAAQLLVSLITVRRAYEDLEAAKLIVLRQGQGSFVTDTVAKGTKRQAIAEARAVLAEAVEHCSRLGLDGAAIRATFDEAMQKEEESRNAAD
ncbi:MAG: GntR family transcriptional regulator [Candidatus Eisenbacteria bacterium]|nr:GntR family transcriptional regulator [Candidatus Eisenbacteria bacterium]